VVGWVVESYDRDTAQPLPLSTRERKIANLIAQGLSTVRSPTALVASARARHER
jgi:ATP/maltotriose-dependent transcriptional regulator MalT